MLSDTVLILKIYMAVILGIYTYLNTYKLRILLFSQAFKDIKYV